MNWRAVVLASLIGLAPLRAKAAEQTLDLRLEHPDAASILLKAIDIRADSIAVAAEIANDGDRELRLNAAHSFALEDDAHGSYRLNPPADNAELRIPAHGRLAGRLVFIGPLNPAARHLMLSTNDGVGTRDNPYDETPIFRADLPLAEARGPGRSARQANHPDGAALLVTGIVAYPGGYAASLVATNGGDREIHLNQDDSLVLTDQQGQVTPLQDPAGNRTLAVPPGDRLDATLIFPAAAAPTDGPVTLSANDGAGGTVDNPYDTMPVFKLTLAVDRHAGDGSLPAARLALAPIARSQLTATTIVARARATAQAPPATNPPQSPVETPAKAPPAVIASIPPAPPPTPAPIVPPVVRPATMGAAQLRSALHAEETEHGLRIVLPADTLFGAAPDRNGDTISGDADTMLQELARLIAVTHPREITVAGHTDGIGSDDDNLKLSEERAHAVAAWIEAHDGRKSPHVVEMGYGRTRPMAPNHNPDGSDNPAGREQNRRVELFLRG